MSDNSVRTPGTGETLRTVDRSSVKTGVTILDVSQAGEAERLGAAPSSLITVTSAGLTTSATAYTAGDVLGSEMTFAGAARFTGGGCQVVSAMLIDKADILGAVDLVLFDRAASPAADNAAATWADADAANFVGLIQFPALLDIGANRVGYAIGGLPLIGKPNATSLFGSLVTRSGHTFFGATTDLIVKLGVIPD